jgi:hypothetical protein
LFGLFCYIYKKVKKEATYRLTKLRPRITPSISQHPKPEVLELLIEFITNREIKKVRLTQ